MAVMFVKLLQIYLKYFSTEVNLKVWNKFSAKILAATNVQNTRIQN